MLQNINVDTYEAKSLSTGGKIARPGNQSSAFFYEVDHSQDQRGNHNPQQLIPVKEGNTSNLWIYRIIKSGPTEANKGEDEKKHDGMELLL
jgi:hypothetical protein